MARRADCPICDRAVTLRAVGTLLLEPWRSHVGWAQHGELQTCLRDPARISPTTSSLLVCARISRLSAPAAVCPCGHRCKAGRPGCQLVKRVPAPRLKAARRPRDCFAQQHAHGSITRAPGFIGGAKGQRPARRRSYFRFSGDPRRVTGRLPFDRLATKLFTCSRPAEARGAGRLVPSRPPRSRMAPGRSSPGSRGKDGTSRARRPAAAPT